MNTNVTGQSSLATLKTYLALGDSMSIDDYTGVEGGSAVNRFFGTLGAGWTLVDHTFDGCQMRNVPADRSGDLITLTIGGNDLLWNKEQYLEQGLDGFAREHLKLLQRIRDANPEAQLMVGDIYHPDAELNAIEQVALTIANRLIHVNCIQVGASIARIYEAFRGRENELLCLQIEPTLKGAEVIAKLFERALAS